MDGSTEMILMDHDNETAAAVVSVELSRADAASALDGMVQLRSMLRMFGQETQLPEGYERIQLALRAAVDAGAPLPLLTPDVE